jgi:hypothetical protein
MTDLLLPLLTSLALLGVATERAMELLINGLKLDDKLPDAKRRAAIYHGLAAVLGAIAYFAMPQDAIPLRAIFGAWAPLFAGLLISAGSGCWHTVLKVLSSFKTKPAS